MGYLFSDSQVLSDEIGHINIAHNNIKIRRLSKQIEINGLKKYNVGDYVPFYFGIKPPMLYAIHKGFVAGYSGGQADIIYMCFDTEDFINQDYQWCYSNGNAASELTNFFEDREFKNLDMDAIKVVYWNSTQDTDLKRRKQSEFLVFEKTACSLIRYFVVQNSIVKEAVNNILLDNNFNRTIRIMPKWYY